jgi:hypothetical protein
MGEAPDKDEIEYLILRPNRRLYAKRDEKGPLSF